MKNIALIILLISAFTMQGQVGINNTSPKAIIDVTSNSPGTPGDTEGVLIPKLSAFPTVDPGVDQNSMLIYMDNAAAPFGKGFYFWNSADSEWKNIGTTTWGAAKNVADDPLIFPINTMTGSNPIAILDNGNVGIGTDQPANELEIIGQRTKIAPNQTTEVTVENTVSDADVELVPGGTGSSYAISAKSGASDGLMIYENNSEVLQLKRDGNLRVDNLESAKNAGIVYPASLYAESDGTVQVTTPYSILDDLKVDLKDFSTVEMIETITVNQEVISSAFYTYSFTPTQDVLLELSYHVGAEIYAYGGGIPTSGDTRHNTKIYGVVLRINGTDFSTMTGPMISNEGLNGYFHMADHLYMPLVADGTTYTITLHGLVQNDIETSAGIRGVFGGNPDDRIQIFEHR